MRWDRLFDDLAGRADDLALTERDALVDDLRDEEWAGTPWRSLLGGTVRLEVLGLGTVQGDVRLATEQLLHLRAAGADHVVALDAVLAVLDAQGRTPEPSRVARALGWGHVLRAARDDAATVRLVRRDGVVHEGTVDVVGRDFVRLSTASGRLQVLPWSALAAVSLRR